MVTAEEAVRIFQQLQDFGLGELKSTVRSHEFHFKQFTESDHSYLKDLLSKYEVDFQMFMKLRG